MSLPEHWTFRNNSHINAKEWYGYGYQCADEPRLRFVDRYYRRPHARIERVWYVDDAQVGGPAEALAALERPCPSSK